MTRAERTHELTRQIAGLVAQMAGELRRGEPVDLADFAHLCVKLADRCLSAARDATGAPRALLP